MNLTKQQAISEHRKMWNWIADETIKREEIVDKCDYFSSDMPRIIYRPLHWCYVCEYARGKCIKLSGSDIDCPICNKHCFDMCKYCPIEWESEAEKRMCENKYIADDFKGLYALWCKYCDEEDWEAAARIAKRIAELSERKEK